MIRLQLFDKDNNSVYQIDNLSLHQLCSGLSVYDNEVGKNRLKFAVKYVCEKTGYLELSKIEINSNMKVKDLM